MCELRRRHQRIRLSLRLRWCLQSNVYQFRMCSRAITKQWAETIWFVMIAPVFWQGVIELVMVHVSAKKEEFLWGQWQGGSALSCQSMKVKMLLCWNDFNSMKSMKWVQQMGISSMTFLGDSQVLVAAIYGRNEGQSEFNFIVNSIRCLLNLHCNFEVKFIRREANMVAHSLTRAANSFARAAIMFLFVLTP